MSSAPGRLSSAVSVSLFALATACAAPPSGELDFPVEPEVFIDEFDAAEGIAFNGEGDLFIAANRAVWRADTSGAVTRLTDVHTNLGLAGFGDRDLLMADFGPTAALADSSGNDGIVWLITPEGDKRDDVRGIADPNFVFVREDGTFLVSDDFTENIYVADTTGALRVWSTAVPYPNGLVSSPDGSTLYVAQIFTIDPVSGELSRSLASHSPYGSCCRVRSKNRSARSCEASASSSSPRSSWAAARVA